ncbi:MAG: hypothetical protein E7363_01745 [Clostridiales bacterium]|nr:hypothetical protein [Clostridiales bacterium]
MQAIKCEMCGDSNLVKIDGVFVCQSCGTKYSLEEAKKLMIEGKVDVSGSVVKIDSSNELENLYQLARRARADEDNEEAVKYYDMILIKDAKSWEATFYLGYYKAKSLLPIVRQMATGADIIEKCTKNALRIIKENITIPEQQEKAFKEVSEKVLSLTEVFTKALTIATNKDIESRIEWENNIIAMAYCTYNLGDTLNLLFSASTEAKKITLKAWKQGVEIHSSLIKYMVITAKKVNKEKINEYVLKIQSYEPTYTLPASGGCYIATCVYGSYNCPQVWTLRRYRDETLGATWYGRCFIRLYYAISPTLVKWFGQTKWFQKIWKKKLDKKIIKLQAKGFADTPYSDKKWK